MTTKEYFDFIVEQIHSTVVATVDEDGLPVTCVIDMMYADDNELYFLTAKGKNFYQRLKDKGYLALSGKKGEDTVVCMDVMPEPEIVDENQSYPSPHEIHYPSLRCRSHKLAMLGKIPCRLVEDTRFDLAGYVYREFGHCFGRAEENVCLNGIGQSEPKGLLHTANVGVTASTLTADAVIELFFSLDKKYRRKAVWMMNDETAMTLRMMKDSAGNFLWRSTDDTIFSHIVAISNYINDSTIVFGDLSYFWLIERQPLAVRPLNELYAQESCLGLIAAERIDGKLVRPEAVKLFKLN